MRPPLIVFVVVGVVVLGVSTVLVVDSPYDSNVVSEQNPFAPERPETITQTTAVAYLVEYEETRLYNDLLGSRGYTFDRRDEVRARCTAISVLEIGDEQFRVRLRCHGRIRDAYRLVRPPTYTYTVTYRITETTLEERSIEDYPFSSRDELRERPPSAT
ncbi:hypothetical protein ACH9L7_16375 (plasmid) [Haloferax sp. S1W]|uniref:hypothetical protein n=1 Tax=Haloferax sp. S1W TaxID=3377110 RepID=UPI0037C751DD